MDRSRRVLNARENFVHFLGALGFESKVVDRGANPKTDTQLHDESDRPSDPRRFHNSRLHLRNQSPKSRRHPIAVSSRPVTFLATDHTPARFAGKIGPILRGPDCGNGVRSVVSCISIEYVANSGCGCHNGRAGYRSHHPLKEFHCDRSRH